MTPFFPPRRTEGENHAVREKGKEKTRGHQIFGRQGEIREGKKEAPHGPYIHTP